MKYLFIILISGLSFGDFCSNKARSSCKRSGECSWGRWRQAGKVGKFQCKTKRNITAKLKSVNSNTRSIASIDEPQIKRKKKKRYSKRSIASIKKSQLRSKRYRPKKRKLKKRLRNKKIKNVTDEWPDL